MKILVLYPNSFPISGAATNRLICITRGLVEQGNSVTVLITRPTENKKKQLNYALKGNYHGVKFEYASNNIFWPKRKFLRVWALFWGLIKTILKLYAEKNNGKIDIIISAATTMFYENLIYSLVCKRNGIKFIHTLDEFPWVNINKENYNMIYRNFYLKNYYKLFDGFICITQTLIDYYKNLSKPNAQFILIPMSIELDRFEISVSKSQEDYIAYCGGDITGTKDGVDILVRAFNVIKEDFPKLKLYIIGKVHQSIFDLVQVLNIDSRVKFFNFVDRGKIPFYLINAKVLCLARPSNLQAEGGFPTKLGEYLATGNPVIITRVGEIPLYLKDNFDSFHSEPDNYEDFAEKIRFVLDNPVIANQAGKMGLATAKKFFDYRKQGIILDQFFKENFK